MVVFLYVDLVVVLFILLGLEINYLNVMVIFFLFLFCFEII